MLPVFTLNIPELVVSGSGMDLNLLSLTSLEINFLETGKFLLVVIALRESCGISGRR
jgi:hypothetical protein